MTLSIFDRLTRLARAEWSHATGGDADDVRAAEAELPALEGEDPPAPAGRETVETGPPRTKAGPSAAGASAAGTFPPEIREAYGVLELRLGATREEAREAYRRLIKRHHPDRHDDGGPREREATERTLRIKEAWERLDTWLR